MLERTRPPTPNDPRSNRTYGYLFNLNQPDEDYSARLDFDLNSSHHFTTRYQYSHQIRETSEVIIGEQAKQDNEQDNFGLTWTQSCASGRGWSCSPSSASGSETRAVRWAS